MDVAVWLPAGVGALGAALGLAAWVDARKKLREARSTPGPIELPEHPHPPASADLPAAIALIGRGNPGAPLAGTEIDPQLDLLTRALDFGEEGLFITAADGVVSYVNRAASKLYGKPPAEMIGTPIAGWHIFQLKNATPAEDMISTVVDTGTWSDEILRVCEDGACRPTLVALSRIDRPGKPPVIAGVIRDLTAQQEMQGEVLRSQKLATLGELAAGVTHEISNPLTSVLENTRFIADAIREAQMDEAVSEATSETLSAALRMRSILEEVRRFSHMGQTGRTETTFDAPISSALMLAGPALKRTAEVIRPAAASPIVWADQGRLTQVILNLIKNAAEAIKETGRTGTILLEHGIDGTQGYLRVIDNGPGISEGVRQRLFKQYITTKEVGRGTGFGLRLCAKLLEEDGGRIDVVSTVGRGATFTIRVPLAADEVESDAARAAGQPPHEEGDITLMQYIDREMLEELHAAAPSVIPMPGSDVPAHIDSSFPPLPPLPDDALTPITVMHVSSDPGLATISMLPEPESTGLVDVLSSFAREMSELESPREDEAFEEPEAVLSRTGTDG